MSIIVDLGKLVNYAILLDRKSSGDVTPLYLCESPIQSMRDKSHIADEMLRKSKAPAYLQTKTCNERKEMSKDASRSKRDSISLKAQIESIQFKSICISR